MLQTSEAHPFCTPRPRYRYVRDRHSDDCHLLPSSDYAQSCRFLLPYDKKHESVLLFLKKRLNISDHQVWV